MRGSVTVVTTPWPAVQTTGTAMLADITPILPLLLTVEAVLEVILEGVQLSVVEAVVLLLQSVEEDVAPVLAVGRVAINPANTPSMTTSTPWRTITSNNYENNIILVLYVII